MGKWLELNDGQRGQRITLIVSEKDIKIAKNMVKRMNRQFKNDPSYTKWKIKDAFQAFLDSGINDEAEDYYLGEE